MTEAASACPHRTDLRALVDSDPYAAYAAAAGAAPVHWDDSLGGWVVLGFDECSKVLKDGDTFVMPWTLLDGGDVALGRYGIFNLSGPEHARVHRELLDFFNPRRNLALLPTVRRLVREAFARVATSDEIDFVHEIAQRVPGLMALAFLGVPEDESVLDTVHEANVALQNYMQTFGDDADALATLVRAHEHLATLWAPVIEQRRREPQLDLISRLVRDQSTMPDWSSRELISQCLFYFGASFGNTANAMANAAYVLVADEQWRHVLGQHPEKVPVFVDEVMRVWASVQFRIRITTRDTEVGGQPIRAGERVIALVAAANRDDAQFPAATRIDVDRVGSRRHLTFGVGSRYCVGATLARLEIEEVIRELLPRLDTVSLSRDRGAARFAGLNYRIWQPFTLVPSGTAAAPATSR